MEVKMSTITPVLSYFSGRIVIFVILVLLFLLTIYFSPLPLFFNFNFNFFFFFAAVVKYGPTPYLLLISMPLTWFREGGVSTRASHLLSAL